MIITLPATADRESLATYASELGLSLRETPDWRKVNTRAPRMIGAFRADNVRLALGPDPDHYRAYSPASGRRTNGVSWEGHRDWMRRVFAAYPSAIIRTGLATYYGADDFDRKYRRTRPGVFGWYDKDARTFLHSHPVVPAPWRPGSVDSPSWSDGMQDV